MWCPAVKTASHNAAYKGMNIITEQAMWSIFHAYKNQHLKIPMIINNLFRIFSLICIIPDLQYALHLVMSMYFNYFKQCLSFLHFVSNKTLMISLLTCIQVYMWDREYFMARHDGYDMSEDMFKYSMCILKNKTNLTKHQITFMLQKYMNILSNTITWPSLQQFRSFYSSYLYALKIGADY